MTIMNIFPTAAMDASTAQLITQVNNLAKLLDEFTNTMSLYYETMLLITQPMEKMELTTL